MKRCWNVSERNRQLTCVTACTRYLFLDMAPCTILHWSSSNSLSELIQDQKTQWTSTPSPSPLPASLIWNLYTDMTDGYFTHLTPKRQQSVLLILTLPTAGETAREGKTYSCSSSHLSDRVQCSAKTGHLEGKYRPPPPAWAAVCWSGCSSFSQRMDVFIR